MREKEARGGRERNGQKEAGSCFGIKRDTEMEGFVEEEARMIEKLCEGETNGRKE